LYACADGTTGCTCSLLLLLLLLLLSVQAP
jgi:hypothetical protein